MMKRLKFLVGMLLVTLVASAQSLSMGGSRVLPTLPASLQSPMIRFDQAPRFVPRRAPINVDEDRQMWWGYYPYSFVEGAIGYGAQQPETYWGAIAIPASEALPQGKSIKGVLLLGRNTECPFSRTTSSGANILSNNVPSYS